MQRFIARMMVYVYILLNSCLYIRPSINQISIMYLSTYVSIINDSRFFCIFFMDMQCYSNGNLIDR